MAVTMIGNIHIVSMDPTVGEIENGYILIEDGKIKEVSPVKEDAPELGEEVSYIDGEGCLAFPGFIDAHNHLGLFNDHLNWEGSDGNELTNPITPELRAIDSIFHDDVNLEESIIGGITTAMTGPGSGNVIGGQFAAIKPFGRSVDDMVLLAPAAMKAALGENPKGVYGRGSKQRPATRMGNAAVLREALTKAKRYVEKQDKKSAEAEKDGKKSDDGFDFSMEALAPVIRRELVLKIHCHRADDILTAIRIANEFGIRYTLDHCTEGYLIADVIEEEYALREVEGHGTLEGVIVGPLLSNRSKPELARLWTGGPAILYETGVPLAIATDHPVIPIQYAALQAASLMRDDLTREAALEGLTTAAAKILGLEDRIGRLAPGLDADIVLWNEDPFLASATTNRVFVNGELAYEE